MSAGTEIQLIAVVTAVASALPGAYLVLRRMALVSDAIAHAILPGIVVAFFLTGSLSSPLLLVAAAATGVLTVAMIEWLNSTRLVAEDAAIGLVFPALFSIGVILVSRYAANVHLDTDSVLLGELAFAPFDRFEVGGADLGPSALWTMGAILVLNLVFIAVAYKELKVATVDSGLAALLGISPALIHYALMAVVSVTAVGAFNVAGSILVVALMIAPPATAYLIVERFAPMLWVSAAVAAACALAGYWIAYALDVSIAGSMATACGLAFALAFLLAPSRGVIAQARRRAGQRLDFSVLMLAVHLLHHEGAADQSEECREVGIHRHLNWNATFTEKVVARAREQGHVRRAAELLVLTGAGRTLAQGAVANPDSVV